MMDFFFTLTRELRDYARAPKAALWSRGRVAAARHDRRGPEIY